MDENEDLTPIDYEPLRDRRILYYEVEEPEDDDSFYSTVSLHRRYQSFLSLLLGLINSLVWGRLCGRNISRMGI